MTIQCTIRFDVKSGEEENFERAYLDGDMLVKAVGQPGFIGGCFGRQAEDPFHYVVSSEWKSLADYERWRKTNSILISKQHLKALLATVTEFFPANVCEVIQSVGSTSESRPRTGEIC